MLFRSSVGDWHQLFAVFAVMVLAAAVLSAAVVPNAAELTSPRLDVASTCLISLALVGLLYGLSTVFSGGFAMAAVALAVGVGCLVAFVVRQGRVAEPLVDLRPFSSRAFVMGLAVIVIALMTVFSMTSSCRCSCRARSGSRRSTPRSR